MLRSLFILLLAVPVASAAPVPKELKQTDEQAILGTWDMVQHSMGGAVPTPQSVKWRLEPNGKAFIMSPDDLPITFKLHLDTSPRGVRLELAHLLASRTVRVEGRHVEGRHHMWQQHGSADGTQARSRCDLLRVQARPRGGEEMIRLQGFDRNRQFHTYHFVRAGESK